MSLINAIRFINVNYNNDNIRINDESLYFDGKSTLISLENGGGKSVMIQMIMAPFIQKSKRDLADRKFSSYFLTSNPSFILIEWKLDASIDEKVMTGMMVRRNQHISDNNENELEIINFVSEYNNQCEADIFHLPVITKDDDGHTILKSFSECLSLFSELKKDRSFKFLFYDMNAPYQASNYFKKIEEFGINYKEWHEIIREVNKEEGGLSKIFSECKDERRLIEKWIFPKIEAKINKENNIIQNIQKAVQNFINHRYQIDESIIKKDAINKFQNDANVILEKASFLLEAENTEVKNALNIKSALYTIKINILPYTVLNIEDKQKNITETESAIRRLQYEEYSLNYYHKEDEFNRLNIILQKKKESIESIQKDINESQHIRDVYNCITLQKELSDIEYRYNKAKSEQEIAQNKLKDSNAEIERLGSFLKFYYLTQIREHETYLGQTKLEIEDLEKNITKNDNERQNIQGRLQKLHEKTGSLKNIFSDYEQSEDNYCDKYEVNFATSLFQLKYEFPVSVFTQHEETLSSEREELQKVLADLRKDEQSLRKSLQDLDKNRADTHKFLNEAEVKKSLLASEIALLDSELNERKVILQYLDLNEDVIFDKTAIIDRSEIKIAELETLLQANGEKERAIKAVLAQYEHGFLEITPELEMFFRDLEIPIVYGLEWLKRHQGSLEEKQKIVSYHKLLPYALIIEENNLAKLAEAVNKVPTKTPIPLILRQTLAKSIETTFEEGLYFYTHFDQAILDEQALAERIKSLNEQLAKLASEQTARQTELNGYRERLTQIKRQEITKEIYEQKLASVQKLTQEIAKFQNDLLNQDDNGKKINADLQIIQQKIQDCLVAQQKKAGQQEDFQNLALKYNQYRQAKDEFKICQDSIKNLDAATLDLVAAHNDLLKKLQFARERKSELDVKIRTLKSGKYQTYQDYPDPTETWNEADIPSIESRYDAIVAAAQGTLTLNLNRIEEDIKSYHEKLIYHRDKLANAATSCNLSAEEWKNSNLTEADGRAAEARLATLKVCLEKENEQHARLCTQWGSCQSEVNAARTLLMERAKAQGPLPREVLSEKNFEHEIAQKIAQKDNFQTELAALNKQREHLTNICDLYADYFDSELEVDAEELPTFFTCATADSRQIAAFLKVKVDVLTKSRYAIEKLKNELINIIAQIYNDYAYDPIRKILPNLQPIATDAGKILRDLPVKLKIFDDMLQKMAKDLTKLDEEKTIIIDLLFDYVEKVHVQLNTIDKNSSIKIRDKSRKTLKIDTLDWDDNAAITQTKIQDFLDSLTANCLKLLKAGQSINDTVALSLTTRDLYDRIVGIASIKINLIKVESQREIMIPWNSVTTNSGGEGFLSSFIVLSSLLSYMRYDEANPFVTGKKEGKTLIMDNPFGKTNASHLLKPLMEIAKINNIQLICLTGLGGDSIYDRFDNIYVLKLIPVDDSGLSYVKTTLQKGKSASIMQLSRLQVYDEKTFFELDSEQIKDMFDIDLIDPDQTDGN